MLGMPVKRFAEVARFRSAHAFLHTAPATTGEIVDRFGYADRSHFVRTPAAVRRATEWVGGRRAACHQRMGIQELRSEAHAAPAAS